MGILFWRKPAPAPVPDSVKEVTEYREKRGYNEADKRAATINKLREQLANAESVYNTAQDRLVEMTGNPRTTPAQLTAQQNLVDQLQEKASQLDALLQQTLYVADAMQPQYFRPK